MHQNLKFTQPLNSWNVSKVTIMSGLKETNLGLGLGVILWTHGMFEGASMFNHELNAWDISSVTTTSYMFAGGWRI